jgi:hypothetical protein
MPKEKLFLHRKQMRLLSEDRNDFERDPGVEAP